MTQVNATQSTAMNMYSPTSSQTSMATDFFGSQAFGNGIVTPQVTPQAVSQPQAAPAGNGTLASAIFQEYLASQNGVQTQAPQVSTAVPTRTPTIEDYYIASQIANKFANDIPLMSATTGFTNNDFLAQQVFNPSATQTIDFSA